MTNGWTPILAMTAALAVFGPPNASGPLPAAPALAAIAPEQSPRLPASIEIAMPGAPDAWLDYAWLYRAGEDDSRPDDGALDFASWSGPDLVYEAERAPPAPPTEAGPETETQWRNTRREMEADEKQLHCLAKNAYFEARGEGEEGMLAVAHVTLNRVANRKYPGQICDVVHQGARSFPCQFTWVCDSKPDHIREQELWEAALSASRRALAEPDSDPTRGALYFHNIALKPKWALRHKGEKTIIGQHVFFDLEDRQHAGNQRVSDNVAVVKPHNRNVVEAAQPEGDVAQAGKAGEQVALVRIPGEDHGGVPAEAGE